MTTGWVTYNGNKYYFGSDGVGVIAAPGLPGRSAPLAAAALMREAIYDYLGEERE